MSPEPIKLWAAPGGRHCLLAPSGSQPPFTVTVLDGPTVFKELSFEDHNAASEFAIAEMHAALKLSDPTR